MDLFFKEKLDLLSTIRKQLAKIKDNVLSPLSFKNVTDNNSFKSNLTSVMNTHKTI